MRTRKCTYKLVCSTKGNVRIRLYSLCWIYIYRFIYIYFKSKLYICMHYSLRCVKDAYRHGSHVCGDKSARRKHCEMFHMYKVLGIASLYFFMVYFRVGKSMSVRFSLSTLHHLFHLLFARIHVIAFLSRHYSLIYAYLSTCIAHSGAFIGQIEIDN